MSEQIQRQPSETLHDRVQEKIDVYQACIELTDELNKRLEQKFEEANKLSDLLETRSEDIIAHLARVRLQKIDKEINALIELAQKTVIATKQASHQLARTAGVDPSLGEMYARPDQRKN